MSRPDISCSKKKTKAQDVWPMLSIVGPCCSKVADVQIPAIVADIGQLLKFKFKSSRCFNSGAINCTHLLRPTTISASVANQRTNSSFYIEFEGRGMLEYYIIDFKNNSHNWRLLLTYSWRISLSHTWRLLLSYSWSLAIVKDYQLAA